MPEAPLASLAPQDTRKAIRAATPLAQQPACLLEEDIRVIRTPSILRANDR